MSSIAIDEDQERDVIESTDANGHTHEPSDEKLQEDEPKISRDRNLKEERDNEKTDEKIVDEETGDKHVVLSPTRRIRKTHIF